MRHRRCVSRVFPGEKLGVKQEWKWQSLGHRLGLERQSSALNVVSVVCFGVCLFQVLGKAKLKLLQDGPGKGSKGGQMEIL